MKHLLIWARENLTVGGPTLVPHTEGVTVSRSLRLGPPRPVSQAHSHGRGKPGGR